MAMVTFVLYLWIMALVEVQCFRTPLPFGTGFQGTTQEIKESFIYLEKHSSIQGVPPNLIHFC